MYATRNGAFRAVDTKEILHFAQHTFKGAGFIARGRLDGVAMHRITDPDHIGTLFLNRLNQTWQVIPHIARTKARNQRQPPGLVFGVQFGHQHLKILSRHAGPAFHANRVQHPTGKFHMGPIGLASTITDPDHMPGSRQPFPRCAVKPRQRLFVFQQQAFVAGVEIHRLQRMGRTACHTGCAHEIKRVGDPVCQITVAFGIFRFREAQRPCMYLVHIRVAPR